MWTHGAQGPVRYQQTGEHFHIYMYQWALYYPVAPICRMSFSYDSTKTLSFPFSISMAKKSATLPKGRPHEPKRKQYWVSPIWAGSEGPATSRSPLQD